MTDDFLIKEHEWPPSSDIMESMAPVIGFTPIKGFTPISVDLKPGFKAYRRDGTIRVADVYDSIGEQVFPDQDEYGVLYFVDQFPGANWAHRCTYIVVLSP